MRATLSLLLLLTGPLAAQRFFPDDPLVREPAPIPVKVAANRKLSDYYDLFLNQFADPGERHPKSGAPIPGQAVNTLGEPMESGWWTRRHYYGKMSAAELKAGPGGHQHPPSTAGKWTVVAAKAEGITPGFTILDADKRRYFVKFDPPTNPEMATAADSITARFFYALGYNVPDNYIIHFRPAQLQLSPDVKLADARGVQRPMTQDDLDLILSRVPASADGTLRATASLAIDGKPIGPPRYFGTRADDPNDVVPHEHRRDLRGLHVFCAWLDHDDSRAINNLDTLVTVDGVPSVKHWLLDFGSTLGSASSGPNSPRSGDYFFSWKSSARQFFTLGLAPPYWAFAHYPNLPSIGRFEWKVFDPDKWVPEYPNTAFLNRLPDDEFWAAKQVMAFSDADIDAIIASGEYTDRAAAAWLAECLRERRNKIGRTYFAKVLPLDRFRVEGGSLAWDDLGREHKLPDAGTVTVAWSRFDNQTGAKSPIAGASHATIPSDGDLLAADLSSTVRPGQTVTVYVRRQAGAPAVIGIDRAWAGKGTK